MKKDRIAVIISLTVIFLSIFIINKQINKYAPKEDFKMVYELKENESLKDVAQKFHVNEDELRELNTYSSNRIIIPSNQQRR